MAASSRRSRSERRRSERERAQDARPSEGTPTGRAFAVPVLATAVLAGISFVPRVRDNGILFASFLGAVAFLALWCGLLFWRVRANEEERTFETLFRPQHYLQAVIQISVYAYWGFFWRPVYEFAWLLVGQIAFAYAFDALLQWSRRRSYKLGFGPFPIILSTNLFLWFRDDWFYLQFLMVAVGFLGKEFVRWQRDGASRHIFNPSAFSLGLFSVVLIAAGASDLTWGQDIASTLTLAPRIYLFLFLLGLVVMYFFSITLVAGTAAAVLFGLSAVYNAASGVPYFLDSEIPAAVFLGLHLLVTDPSTSPRTPMGKAIFGGLYGVGVFVLYAGLSAIGAPTFYDKLMAVPLLNLSVQWIDHLARRLKDAPALARLSFDTVPNAVHMSVWIGLFAIMTVTGRTDGRHVGDSLPFWQQACEEGRPNACERLVQLETTYCTDNSGWACNELGLRYRMGEQVSADPDLAYRLLSQACEARFQAACFNLLEPGRAIHAVPRASDLRLLLREGGRNLVEMPEPQLYARACDHDWAFACDRLAGAM